MREALSSACWPALLVLGLCTVSFTSHHLLWELPLLYPFLNMRKLRLRREVTCSRSHWLRGKPMRKETLSLPPYRPQGIPVKGSHREETGGLTRPRRRVRPSEVGSCLQIPEGREEEKRTKFSDMPEGPHRKIGGCRSRSSGGRLGAG